MVADSAMVAPWAVVSMGAPGTADPAAMDMAATDTAATDTMDMATDATAVATEPVSMVDTGRIGDLGIGILSGGVTVTVTRITPPIIPTITPLTIRITRPQLSCRPLLSTVSRSNSNSLRGPTVTNTVRRAMSPTSLPSATA